MGVFGRCKNKGSILATVKRTDASSRHARVGKGLKGVRIRVTPTDRSGTTGRSGTKEFTKLEPRTYTVTAVIDNRRLSTEFDLVPPVSLMVPVAAGQPSPADFQVNRLASLKVHVHLGASNLTTAKVTLTGTQNAEETTDPQGIADFGRMPLGDYTATIGFEADDPNDLLYLPPTGVQQFSLGRDADLTHPVVVEQKPTLEVTVQDKETNKKLNGFKVKASGGGKSPVNPTAGQGVATFPNMSPLPHSITVELDEQQAKVYEAVAAKPHTVVRGPTNRLTVELVPKITTVYFKLALKDPDNKDHLLPKDLPLKVVCKDDHTVAGKLDAKGHLVDSEGTFGIKLERCRETFSLTLGGKNHQYLVFEKAGVEPATQELITDDNPLNKDGDLYKAMAAGKRAVRLPEADWKLAQADWEVKTTDTYTHPNFKIQGETIGTAEAPVSLTVKPQWQYVRLEYFDRRFSRPKHSKKRVAVPPLLLKAVRKGGNAKPTAFDAGSNWAVKTDDPLKACQAVPWIVTKKANGDALPALDKTLLFEFAMESHYVVAASGDPPTRTIKKLDKAGADKDKLKPSVDRPLYYDLPKLWRSKNQYVRFADGSGKLADTLTAGDISNSLGVAKPLIFSLDDIVLTKTNGSQLIKDKDDTDTDKALSDNSRVTLLYLDSEDADHKFKVKVYKPKASAVYSSNLTFKKNIITDYYPETRVVVFCNGFYDIFDKRTEEGTAGFDYAKHIVGARAARLDDNDVSGRKIGIKGLAGTDPVTKAYAAKETGNFDLHYLHYGAVDTKHGGNKKRVISALITYWTCRLKVDATKGGTNTDKTHYAGDGMKNAMERWNVKDYQLEVLGAPADETEAEKKHIIVKTSCLFEAKLQTPAKRGGKHKCLATLQDDREVSYMAHTTAMLHSSGYALESKLHGSGVLDPDDPNNTVADYDGSTTRLLYVAHEFGHASGLDDDYADDNVSGESWDPMLGYTQYYPGMPYQIDAISLMDGSHAVRMRQYWNRVNWVNDEAKAGKDLHAFLQAKKLGLTFDPAGKPKLTFELTKDKYRNICKPAYEKTDHDLGNNAKADLLLYKLGDGEFCRAISGGQTYDGMLLVRSKIAVQYTDDTSNWDDDDRYDWMNALYGDLNTMLNKKFRLAGVDNDKDFTNVYIFFVPHWAYDESPGGTHHEIEVTYDDSDDFAKAGSDLEVGNDCNNNKIIRFLFGRSTALVTDLAAADLAKLKDWVAGKTGNGFAVRDL